MMTIGLITYNKSHRKTQDVLFRLLALGYTDIWLIILPWVERAYHKSLFPHRPDNPINIMPKDMGQSFRLVSTFVEPDGLAEHLRQQSYDRIAICGAGILTPDITKFKVINSHPGYLPFVRGLDALKWAILEGYPIGVTTHHIGADADTGFLIDQEIVPLNFNDDFSALARRQYETEVRMLVDAIVSGKETSVKLDDRYRLHGRMDHMNELRMIKKFKDLQV